MDRTQFPWRPLGSLLVDEGLVTPSELEQALAEHRRTGRLLGEILVDRGSMTAVALAQALARQHGVQLRATGIAAAAARSEKKSQPDAPAAPTNGDGTWRPLGKLLVEKGFLSAATLHAALAEQREHPGRRLGEILVAGGHLSGRGLALALADQHGVAVDAQGLTLEVEAVERASAPADPTYHVWDVAYDPAYARRSVLYKTTNFLEAADFACEYVDRHRPQAIEIEKRSGTDSTTVWTYSEARAAAAAAAQKSSVETFGFDPARWGSSL